MQQGQGTGLLSRMPLYARILLGMGLGVAAGLVFGPSTKPLDTIAQLVLRLLGALAPALIAVAVIQAIITAEIRGRVALRIGWLLLSNTTVAILIGLGVANLLRPGAGAHLPHPERAPGVGTDVVKQLLDNVPDSLLRPFVENRVIGVVLISLAFGIACRRLPEPKRKVAEDLVGLGFSAVLEVLSWVIAIVPFAVFGKVASIIGSHGFHPFVALGKFVLAVLLALLAQTAFYLARIRVSSWVRPLPLLRGTRDALVLAFSTGSSTMTMPVTYDRLRSRVGLRDQSASLGALVGSNFNNDGTALYEAMAALFIAQLLNVELSLGQQVLVVLTSVVASVGAAGIPEAGLVTMTLVFTAVKLPTEYIALLLTVDWFLDRCRTVINVIGDMTVASVLDGPTKAAEAANDGSAPSSVLTSKPEI
ncbi:MAG: dicarboxylate/amino acid:cation symporter [Polyangiaceae bacterium]|jgi:DAACS family dicarboxylate/amino acid:cation (Na+ or H+) symporter|nr:dicarboxylate/amino acid:cation symporter [Polyangiaceae bacterium]